MEIYSDSPEGGGTTAPAPQAEHRVRWGNVALAVAALAAVAAAVLMPRGQGDAPPRDFRAADRPPVVTAPVGATPEASRPETRRRPAKRRRRRGRARRASPRRQARAAYPAPPPQPLQASVPSNPPPAAEREFGL